MQFLKGVWTFLVGVKDALVLLFMLLLFGLLWAGLANRTPRISVPDGAALHIDLQGTLVDQASEPSPLAALSGNEIIPEIETARLVKAIDTAADDSAISMITLDLDSFIGGGLANLESVGAALDRFRAKNKEVEVWATAYGDDGYYLAAHASSVGMSPMGAVLISGPGGSGLYFKEALDRLKVDVEVFRVGTYKSFVEPFTRNDSSPEARAADQALADDLWANWRANVQKERQDLDIQALLTSWPQRLAGANQDQAQLAKSAGLVDVVMSEAQWRAKLRERLGDGDEPDRPGDFKRIAVRDYLAAREPITETGAAVAVVHVGGTIVDGSGGSGQAGGDSVAALIEEAIADSDVKALVVRVNSGGGSAFASEQIRQAMLEAKRRKLPVIASFGPVAASGGYWIGAGADMIFASPTTITGSIGVFGIIPTFERTLKDFGVSADGVATTPFSGQPDIVGGLNEPTRALIQSGIADTYRRFIALVAEARKMPPADVEAVAEGRLWSGRQALTLKLVDRFGDLDAAVLEAGRRAGIEGKPRVLVMREPQSLLFQLTQRLEGADSAPRDALSRAITASRWRAIAQVEAALAVANGPTIQAHCLGCAAFAPPHMPAPATTGILQALQARLLD